LTLRVVTEKVIHCLKSTPPLPSQAGNLQETGPMSAA
jgi:hypothetical protein